MVGGGPRLYPAEAVAAALEVKSDVSAQWNGVCNTSRSLRPLRRHIPTGAVAYGPPPKNRIPFFAVGYNGWSRIETLQRKLVSDEVDGILVINPGLFASNKDFGSITVKGPAALWGLISCLHQALSTLKIAYTNIGIYLEERPEPS